MPSDASRREPNPQPNGAEPCCFEQTILDALPAHVAVLNERGDLVAVNESWRRFARENSRGEKVWLNEGANYLDVCRKAAAAGDVTALKVYHALDDMLAGRSEHFVFEYTCDGPGVERWFEMQASRRPELGGLLVTHTDCTGRKRVEAELQRSENELRSIMDAEPALISYVDTDYRYRRVNRSYERWFGKSPEEVRGHHIRDVLGEAAWEEVRPFMERALAGEMVSYDRQLHYRGIEPRWVHVTYTPDRDHTGRVRGFVVLVVDLDSHKQIEESLRENEERLRLSVETAALGSYERDLVANRIVVDTNWRTIMGLPEGTLPDPDIARKTLYPEDRERVFPLVERAFDPKLREIAAADFRIVRPNGEVRWVAGRGRVIFDETMDPPRPIKFLGVLQDITERKRAEERAAELLVVAERRAAELVAVIEAIPEALYIGNANGITRCNTNALRMLGASSLADLQARIGELGKKFAVRWPDTGRLLRDDELPFSRALCGETVIEEILATHAETGQNVFIRSACAPVIGNGKVIGAVAVNSDITDQKRVEAVLREAVLGTERSRQELERLVDERTARLRETIGELEHFSYTITHDMRAPLRAMEAFGNILRTEYADRMDDTGKDFTRRIVESAQRMDRLITDALSYSKVVQTEMELEPVNAGLLLRGMLESYPEFQWPRVDIALSGNIPPVMANTAGLTQCFSNLLNNAIKFVERGKVPQVRIRAETREASPDGGGHHRRMVRIWFEDNGIGIPEDQLQRIFVMFQRVSKDYEGTGIGLALVRKMVERMKGAVGVESVESNGSRFWLELAAVPAGDKIVWRQE